MKRLVWILLAVLGTALAQVPPVVVADAPHKTCCCCDHPGSCGMPNCLPPVSSTALVSLDRPAATATVGICRVAQSSRRIGEKFFAAFVAPAAVSVAARSPNRVMPRASVPLFKAHCSFLV